MALRRTIPLLLAAVFALSFPAGAEKPPAPASPKPPASPPGRGNSPPEAASLLEAGPTTVAGDASVDLKNDATLTISVPMGSDNGVTTASDFLVIGWGGFTVVVYPEELYQDRFWSQMLPEDEFARIGLGMPVRPVALDPMPHAQVRSDGVARRAVFREKQEAARRETAARELEEVRARLSTLEEQRDALDTRVAAAEQELAGEGERTDWLSGTEDRDIDRALQNILDLSDQRDELQERRTALAGQTPYPRDEISRLSAEIQRLNGRISSERDNIRLARDRKRSARTSYMSVKQEWQRLVGERNELAGRIRALERKARDLSAAARPGR